MGLGEAAPDRELGRTPPPPDVTPPARACPDDEGADSCMFRSRSTKDVPRAELGRSGSAPEDVRLGRVAPEPRTRENMFVLESRRPSPEPAGGAIPEATGAANAQSLGPPMLSDDNKFWR